MVVLGGMLGTALRAQLEGAFAAPAGEWPWVTFVINLVGSFVLGALLEVLSRTGADAGWRRAVRIGLGTGVIGGFTTYSTFIVETALLVRDGHAGTGAVYAVVSLVLGLLSATTGFVVGAAVTPATTSSPAARTTPTEPRDRAEGER
ncbi:putative fluoride ion transporter CrcB [mine drainage metagenome]|uniref:Putative fluoride ion transporter CrcB n=1 Tax=mine drainage metagenome TaxID=410659 RepID=A0A1J5R813_9ZZZZ